MKKTKKKFSKIFFYQKIELRVTKRLWKLADSMNEVGGDVEFKRKSWDTSKGKFVVINVLETGSCNNVA